MRTSALKEKQFLLWTVMVAKDAIPKWFQKHFILAVAAHSNAVGLADSCKIVIIPRWLSAYLPNEIFTRKVFLGKGGGEREKKVFLSHAVVSLPI